MPYVGFICCAICVSLHAFLTKWNSWLWFLTFSQLSGTYKKEWTCTPFASMFPLHSCIVFLCHLLFFPQWNFFLPAFLNRLFLAFELTFILCTLACSYWLTPGSWQKTSGSAWRCRLHFLSRGGRGDVSSSSWCVWEIPTPVKGPVWLCTDQQQNYQWFLWLTTWAST